MSDHLTINGIKGSVIEVDDARLLVNREFHEGLLDINTVPGGVPFMVRDVVTGDKKFPDTNWLEEMLRQGRLRIVADEHGPVPTAREKAELDHEAILAKDAYAGVKRALVRGLAEQGVQSCDDALPGTVTRLWNGELAPMVAAVHAARPDLKRMERPADSTVRTWMSKVNPAEATLADMMSKSGRVARASQLDPAVVEILLNRARWFYGKRGHRQIDVRPKVNSDIDIENVERATTGLPALPYPGKETIRRYIENALCRETFAEKYGEKAAKSRWDGAGKGLKATKILQLALIDDTVLDAVAVFDTDRNVPAGRPWLCLMMDVHSRCILGWVLSFTPPTIHTAAECIRRANRPKFIRPDLAARYPGLARINGKVSRLLADNGVNYVSTPFQDMLADLGITLQLAAVGSPTHKAMIERLFYTLKTWLLQKLPGHTLDIKLLREFDIDPEKEAVLTLSELELLIAEFVNSYHLTVHTGIDAQPARKWEISMRAHGRDVLADESRLAVLTGVVLRNRRLYRGAIRFMGLVYRDAEISAALNDDLVGAEPHRNRVSSGAAVASVTLKYDPANLGRVHVMNRVRNEWIALPCTDPDYAEGLTLWQHNQVRAWAKRKNVAFNTEAERMGARDKLNDLILELAPDMPARERRAVARMTGKPATPDVSVEVAHAEPRHDGMGPIIEHDTAEDREDSDIAPNRPAKSGGKARKPEEGDGLVAEDDDVASSFSDGQYDDDDDAAGLGDDRLPIDEDAPAVTGTMNDDERFEEYV